MRDFGAAIKLLDQMSDFEEEWGDREMAQEYHRASQVLRLHAEFPPVGEENERPAASH